MLSDFEDRYRLDISSGYSVLNRLGEMEFQPDAQANQRYNEPYANIYEDAVYGGDVDPETSQHFQVYDVDWSEEVERPTNEDIDNLSEELDRVFAGGWVLSEDAEKVFALSQGDVEPEDAVSSEGDATIRLEAESEDARRPAEPEQDEDVEE